MLQIHQRIELKDKRRGIIRFIGNINNKEWVGIEFDLKSSGKHDGKGYFKVHPKQSASLFKMPISYNEYFTVDDAINIKYFSTVEDVQTDIGNVPLTTVGWDKVYTQIKNNLMVVSLQEMCINTLVCRNCYNKITELSLSGNLFQDLSEFPASAFPSLTTLDISSNRFTNSILPSLNIVELVISNTLLLFKDIVAILKNQPRLVRLFISDNYLFDLNLDNSDALFQDIQELDISHNHFQSLSSIFNIFPNVQRLNASHNQISNISYSISLVDLNLNGNQFNNYDFLTFLNVKELRLLRNPMNSDDTRYFITALIPGVSTLNGSSISIDDRKDAEIYFLKHFTDQQNLRYLELSQSWHFQQESKSNLKSTLVKVIFTHGGVNSIKMISPNLKADMIAKIAQRLFKLEYAPSLYIGDILMTEPLNVYVFEVQELKIICK